MPPDSPRIANRRAAGWAHLPRGPPIAARTCSFMPLNARPRSALLGSRRARGAVRSHGNLGEVVHPVVNRRLAADGRPLCGCGSGWRVPVIDSGHV